MPALLCIDESHVHLKSPGSFMCITCVTETLPEITGIDNKDALSVCEALVAQVVNSDVTSLPHRQVEGLFAFCTAGIAVALANEASAILQCICPLVAQLLASFPQEKELTSAVETKISSGIMEVVQDAQQRQNSFHSVFFDTLNEVLLKMKGDRTVGLAYCCLSPLLTCLTHMPSCSPAVAEQATYAIAEIMEQCSEIQDRSKSILRDFETTSGLKSTLAVLRETPYASVKLNCLSYLLSFVVMQSQSDITTSVSLDVLRGTCGLLMNAPLCSMTVSLQVAIVENFEVPEDLLRQSADFACSSIANRVSDSVLNPLLHLVDVISRVSLSAVSNNVCMETLIGLADSAPLHFHAPASPLLQRSLEYLVASKDVERKLFDVSSSMTSLIRVLPKLPFSTAVELIHLHFLLDQSHLISYKEASDYFSHQLRSQRLHIDQHTCISLLSLMSLRQAGCMKMPQMYKWVAEAFLSLQSSSRTCSAEDFTKFMTMVSFAPKEAHEFIIGLGVVQKSIDVALYHNSPELWSATGSGLSRLFHCSSLKNIFCCVTCQFFSTEEFLKYLFSDWTHPNIEFATDFFVHWKELDTTHFPQKVLTGIIVDTTHFGRPQLHPLLYVKLRYCCDNPQLFDANARMLDLGAETLGSTVAEQCPLNSSIVVATLSTGCPREVANAVVTLLAAAPGTQKLSFSHSLHEVCQNVGLSSPYLVGDVVSICKMSMDHVTDCVAVLLEFWQPQVLSKDECKYALEMIGDATRQLPKTWCQASSSLCELAILISKDSFQSVDDFTLEYYAAFANNSTALSLLSHSFNCRPRLYPHIVPQHLWTQCFSHDLRLMQQSLLLLAQMATIDPGSYGPCIRSSELEVILQRLFSSAEVGVESITRNCSMLKKICDVKGPSALSPPVCNLLLNICVSHDFWIPMQLLFYVSPDYLSSLPRMYVAYEKLSSVAEAWHQIWLLVTIELLKHHTSWLCKKRVRTLASGLARNDTVQCSSHELAQLEKLSCLD